MGWPFNEAHRLANDRRNGLNAVNSIETGHPFRGGTSNEAGAAEHNIAADGVAGLVGLAARQGGLERAGEHAQRRRQGYHHRQRGIRQGAPRHPAQGQRGPRRRHPLRRPRGGGQRPGQDAKHQKGQGEQRRRRRQQQRGVQSRPPFRQRPLHKAAPLPDLPDQQPQRHYRQDINIVALQPRRGRRTGAGAQKVQYAQPRQAAARRHQRRQTQQPAQSAHSVHLPRQGYGKGRFAHALPRRRLYGRGQQQAADAPGQQRANQRGDDDDDALAQSQQAAHLRHAGPPAAEH